MLTEKHQEFHKALAICADIEAEIAESEERTKQLRAKLAQAEGARDTVASAAAEEKISEGFIAIQMPNGELCGVAKAKKRKGGELPPNAYVVRYDDRFDANMRRIQTKAGEEQ